MKSERELYNTDGTFRKDITLEEIRSLKTEHGELIGVNYSRGGGMLGDSTHIRLYRNKEQKPEIETGFSGQHNWPLVIKVYDAEEEVFPAMTELIDRDNLTVWENLPRSEEEVMDAPSTTISLYFEEAAGEKRKRKSCSIEDWRVVPEGGREVMRSFIAALAAAAQPERMREAYFVIDGESYKMGESSDCPDETIMDLLQGCWETGPDESRRMRFYGPESEAKLVFSEETDGTYVDHPYTLVQIEHHAWNSSPCGWHIRLEDEAGNEKILYIEGVSLVLSDGETKSVLDRFS